MKIKFLRTGLLGMAAITAFGQKGALKDATESYNNYTVEAGQKLLATKAQTDLNDAKTAIDKAAGNEKTATLPETYALKAAIYAAIASTDTVAAHAEPLLTAAKDALTKAKDADTKGENKKLITDAGRSLAIYYQSAGVKQFQSKKYDLAYHSFDSWNQYMPDTIAVFYAGVSAGIAGNTDPKYYAYAIASYNKLLPTNFSKNPDVYHYLSAIYEATKDTANALKTANAGVEKYPNDAALRETQIKLALMSGKQDQILEQIDAAIKSNPKNKVLYYYKGITYSRIGDAFEAKAKKNKDAAAKESLTKEDLDNYAKAVDAYKQSLALDPDFFDANLNLGNALMKPAIVTYNKASFVTEAKQYNDMRNQADAQFDLAKPYLQKAVDLNPKSSNALSNLWNYYRGKYEHGDKAAQAADAAKAADLKKQIDALPQDKNQ